MDAHDRRAAFDHVVLQAGAAASSRSKASPSCFGADRPTPSRPDGRLVHLDELLPGDGRHAQVARPAIARGLAETGGFGRRSGGCSTHCENTDGLGAIFPPMVYSIIALRCLGYELDSPEVEWALEQLRRPADRAKDDRVRVQPCLSPVWDTAIATICLADAGVPAEHPAWKRAIDWLLSKEVRHPGDWQIRRPGVEPTGWHFQFHNAFYPDLDDTAMVLLGLKRSPLASEPAVAAAIRRGVDVAALNAESRRRLGGLRRRHR